MASPKMCIAHLENELYRWQESGVSGLHDSGCGVDGVQDWSRAPFCRIVPPASIQGLQVQG